MIQFCSLKYKFFLRSDLVGILIYDNFSLPPFLINGNVNITTGGSARFGKLDRFRVPQKNKSYYETSYLTKSEQIYPKNVLTGLAPRIVFTTLFS